MEISTYDFLVLFVVVPLLLFKFTLIPDFIFEKVRILNPVLRNIILALLLASISGLVVASCAQGFSIRIVALTVAILVCIVYYLYNYKKR